MLLSLLLSFFVCGEFPLVDIQSVQKNILVEMRYATDWNFIGKKLNGYRANKCFLSKPATEALSKVQVELEKTGLSLLVFDCYRPQRTISQFVAWSQNINDQKMKSIYYPDEQKQKLFRRGYIAHKSGHSRGSTVDLTVVDLKKVKMPIHSSLHFKENITDCRNSVSVTEVGQLDMGTSYDCFDDKANTNNDSVNSVARENRQKLKVVMEKFGFENYSKEWWHYTLKTEPFPKTYFDQEIVENIPSN